MSYQTLYITKPCFLKVQRDQMVIQEKDKAFHIPLEDLASVIIETLQATVTSALLSRLADHGCHVIFCGEKHHPNALQLPFLPHSRQAQITRLQAQWSEAFKKRCHQKIIQKKIENQLSCMHSLSGEIPGKMKGLASKVKLGDKDNMESYTASLYFTWYLEGESRRQKEIFINKALNYGYAIIRSRIAQYLTASGFISCLGLFHHNDLNNYNLADDMIEPYRPFVDWSVRTLLNCHEEELSGKDKAILIKIPEMELVGDQNILLSQLMKESVNSLRKATEKNTCEKLEFPDFIPLQERTYE